MLNKEIQYSKTILAYYAILMIILVYWTNVNSLPPFFLRLMFLMAVVLPLWVKRTRLFVPIFLTFIMTSASSYAVSYMPVDGLNILLTIVMSILIISRTHTGSLSVPFGFIIPTIFNFFSLEIIIRK